MNRRPIRLFQMVLLLVAVTILIGGDLQAKGLERGTPAYEESLVKDIGEREKLPETDVPRSEWYTAQAVQGWGPMPRVFPKIERLVETLPPGTDIIQWKRDRVIAIAKHYIGLPYRHHHIPGWSPATGSKLNPQPGPGLDCSDFTAWVYNFGFGIPLNSDVVSQSQMQARPGYILPKGIRRIEPGEGFLPGDLLYIMDSSKTHIVHVVLFIDEEHIIDSTGTHVDVRHFSGWYRERLSHGIRIF